MDLGLPPDPWEQVGLGLCSWAVVGTVLLLGLVTLDLLEGGHLDSFMLLLPFRGTSGSKCVSHLPESLENDPSSTVSLSGPGGGVH